MKTVPAAALLVAALTGSAMSDDSRPRPCDSPDHRAFDFWLGDWTAAVTGDEAKLGGTNHIVAVQAGCVVLENWTGSSGLTGMSQNIFAGGRWHQIWTDSGGGLLVMEGERQGEAMIMQTATPTDWGDETPGFQRITWTPNADGSVRQHGERSADGKIWTTNFDLTYRRAS